MANISRTMPLLALLLLAACNQNNVKVTTQDNFPSPPDAKQIPQVFEEFGNQRVDNYYWIRSKENQDAIDYLNAENDYTQTVMASTKELQDKIYNEIIGRIKEQDESYPVYQNGYYYYSRTETGKQYRVYCRRKGTMEAPEEITFDVNKMAEGKKRSVLAVIPLAPTTNWQPTPTTKPALLQRTS